MAAGGTSGNGIGTVSAPAPEESAAWSAHWIVCDQLLRDAEVVGPAFHEDHRAQGELLYQLSEPSGGYWHLPAAHRQSVLSRVMALVPRVEKAPEPLITMERIFRLHHGPNPEESIARAVKVRKYEPRPLEPGEEIYKVGGLLEEIVDWTRESNTPAAFLFGGGIVALAAVCGYNFWIDRHSDHLRLGQHYAIFTGKKGAGKSVGMDAAKELLHRVNHLIYPWVPGGPPPDLTPPNPFKVRFMPEDTNWRTIVGCLQTQARTLQGFIPDDVLKSRPIQNLIRAGQGQFFPPDEGVLLLDEAATIFGKQNFAVDRIVPGLNTTSNGRPYVYQTQSGGLIELKRPAIVFAGNCPPDILQTALTPTVFGGGFLDRVNIIHHEPLPGPGRYPTARPRDPVVAAHLANWLVNIRRMALFPYEMVARPDAEALYDGWYHEQREADDKREWSLSRRANHFWRYAAYISLSNDRQPYITVRDFELALPILEEEMRGYRALLAEMDIDPQAELMQYLERLLLRRDAVDPGDISHRDLMQAIKDKKGLVPPNQRAVPLLEALEGAGRIVIRVNGPRRAYSLTRETAAELRGSG